jgi:hypothetical protein
MVLPNKGDLKARVSPGMQHADQVQRLENLKSCPMKAYKELTLNNRKARQNRAYYKLRRGNFRLTIRFVLPCYETRQMTSLDSSGKDPS